MTGQGWMPQRDETGAWLVQEGDWGRAITGRGFPNVHLNREPRTVAEAVWLREQVAVRLEPGGAIIGPVGAPILSTDVAQALERAEPREDVADVVEVLAAHQRVLDGAGSCRCGSWPPAEHDVDWLTHLADALAPLIAERVQSALNDVDRRLTARIGEGRDDPETAREGSYFAGFLDALESARAEVRWKRPDRDDRDERAER